MAALPEETTGVLMALCTGRCVRAAGEEMHALLRSARDEGRGLFHAPLGDTNGSFALL